MCQFSVRLVDGTSYSGRVEVQFNNVWGTVMVSSGWMMFNACSGQEERLADCSFGGWGPYNCGSVEDAGVICY